MTTTPIEAVDRALAAIARYDRPDLEARLRQARARLADDHVRLLVVGEFKQGKSMLVNGLLGAPVCPVFDDIATSVPTVVRYAEQPTVTLVREEARIEVPVDQLPAYASEAGNPGNRERLDHIEVGIPRPILAEGLELVDTPGVGGLGSAHGAATMSALPSADAVLLVSDASQEYTAPELEFLRNAVSVCPNVACVVTKTDLYPEWRTIAQRNQTHLESVGIKASFFMVSSTLRWHALQTGDQEVNKESGYPPLVTYIRKKVLGEADSLARRSTAHDVHAVIDQITESLRAEQAAQSDPASAAALIDRLTLAEQRAAGLKERSARWQQTLSDGVADLNADVDYDLRDRMREIVREAEEALAAGDPTKIWDQFSKWVQDAAASAVSANSVWATQRARWLARRVAEHFDSEREQMLPSLQTASSDPLRSVREMSLRADEKWGIGGRLLTGLKGGYSGLLMFGLLGTVIGLSLINPISIGAGLLLGGKTIGDERKRIVQRRQNDAKTALRKYIDDVTFHAGKDSRDILRAMQRDLRDHFTTLAEQLKRSLQESIQAAQKSVKASSADRSTRLEELAAELAALEKVRQEVTP
ncbi:Isoniazid-inducible protein iniA [Lentzea tibetensis]|uniref:Isoniazid-inducible protein iniA n=1 Tax=Lentzea tibetensis TaxID=2591470 RepID=A0A563EIF8_9PSEU|nr:dynamin family protein [Lentzea tibetensis]TWP46288.1 Isoniazid-inducible protein iniA [Lentzea tibetensis]